MTFTDTLNILVVDDNEINLLLSKKVLAQMNSNISVAKNGQEAVEEALKNDYDLILMDIHMPVMDGYTATKTLREANFTGPIFALTASITFIDKDVQGNNGIDDFIQKPFSADVIFEKYQKYLAAKN